MNSIHGLAISASIKLFNIIDVISLVSTEQVVDCVFLSNMLYEKQVKLISQENEWKQCRLLSEFFHFRHA